MMQKDRLVWLIPLLYIFHLAEEYYGGPGLVNWLSQRFDAQFTERDFLLINMIMLSAVVLFAIVHFFIKRNVFLLCTLTTIFFLNGLVHLLGSLFSMTYSPGLITGVLLYIPLGILVYKHFFGELSVKKKKACFLVAAFIHIIISIIALNI